MMTRILAGTLVAAAVGMAVGACDDGRYRNRDGYDDACYQYSSCGSCTPVAGCGWCYNSDGTGQCAAGPGACTTTEFTWTWNPDGCRATADAGVGSTCKVPPGASTYDAGAPGTGDAGDAAAASDGAPDGSQSNEGGAPAATGCEPHTGSNLCSSTQYELTCHGTLASSTPAPSLGCSIVTSPTPPDVLFYCCPCAP